MSGAGSIILVSYGEENMFLNDKPEISFFKIIYRRHTNFAIQTVKSDFTYLPDFGGKYSMTIPKSADLLTKPWIVITLPELPIIYDKSGNVDSKLKTAWAVKIAYRIIDSIEFVISNKIIQKTWGEYMNILDEYNIHNFNSSLNPYIGNIPEIYDYYPSSSIRNSYVLYVPILFFFFNTNKSLPLVSLTNSEVSINVTFNPIEMCINVSPTNYIDLQNYYGNPIFKEPLVQYTPNGIVYCAFDSIDDMVVNGIIVNRMYYRKISNYSFITTDSIYYKNYSFINVIQNYFEYNTQTNYFVYGLWSKTLFVPISNDSLTTNNLENKYIYTPFLNNISLGQTYMLFDYVFITKEERTKYYESKHEYVIEQVYFTTNQLTTSVNSKNNIEITNPCKYVVFMAQLSYLNNQNVNDGFNYTNTWVRDRITNKEVGIPLIKKTNLYMNSKTITDTHDMSYYNNVLPFFKFPKCRFPNSVSIYNFNLYPFNMQQSGSINTSKLSNIYFINNYQIPDVNNIEYYFKSYFVGVNVLRIIHGVGETAFYSVY